MTLTNEARFWTLAPVFLILAVLVFAVLFWCLLSSCLGTPLRRFLSDLWGYALLSAEQNGARRSRRGFGEQEQWEMEYRHRNV
ncbi:hypothetical protein E4T56_gene8182 [Termitomyces sp. T112]|nr:hypothetical protein E4T56_gene8182 [Termitomyces sp. T112]